MSTLPASLLSLIATVFWIGYFLYAAPLRFIPARILTILFTLGVTTAVAALVAEQALFALLPRAAEMIDATAGSPAGAEDVAVLAAISFLAIAPIEESVKFAVLVPLLARLRFFRNPLDGMMFGLMVGLGMAAVENWIVFAEGIPSWGEAGSASLFALRLMGSTLAHALYGAILGYFIGQANASRLWRRRFLVRGLATSVLVHGLFDFFLFVRFGPFSFFGLIALLALSFRWYTDRKNFLEALVSRSTESLGTLSLSDRRELENTILQSFPAHLLVSANLCPRCFRRVKPDLPRCSYCGAGFSSALRNRNIKRSDAPNIAHSPKTE